MVSLIDYGFLPDWIQEIPAAGMALAARVLAVHKDRYALICEQGELYGRLKTGVYFDKGGELFPTTGDFVLILYNPNGDSQIMKTLERKTFFSRREPGPIPRDQAVAANFDYVFIVQSLNHDFNPSRLERYLTLAWQSGAIPVVVLTKADLVDDYTKQLRTAQGIAMGVAVFAVSARTGAGLESLTDYLQPGKTIVLLGSSGVGKSSLVNALAGEDRMAVSEIRQNDSRGRHTTTYRQLIMLQSGVMIIDTPGMRELGMWDVSSGLGGSFADVEQYFGRCRFSDCKHQSEPGCAVKAALENGELPLKRWESYIALKNESMYAENRNAYLKQKQQRHKDISKRIKQIKTGEW